jgi:flagellar hook assembly protein FlgD
VKLAIYDVLGREIRVLQGGVQAAGTYSLIWDSRDSRGERVSSGVYYYRLIANYLELTRKMILVR